MRVVKGDRFKVTKRLAVKGTAGGDSKIAICFEGYLKVGEVVCSIGDMQPIASAFYCVPEKKGAFERNYIPKAMLQNEGYKGIYGLLLPVKLVGKELKQIESAPLKPLSLDEVKMETCKHLSFEQDLPNEVRGMAYQPWCLLQRDTKGDAGTKLTLRIKRAAEKAGLKTRANKCPFMVNEALVTCPCFETKVIRKKKAK